MCEGRARTGAHQRGFGSVDRDGKAVVFFATKVKGDDPDLKGRRVS